MTVAALEALALQACLERGLEGLGQRFFKQASKIVDIAWGVAAGNDLNLSGAGTALPPPMRFINWYVGKLQIAARYDPVVALAFMKVANLMKAPPSLLNPAIAARVLWRSLRPGAANGALKGHAAAVQPVETG